MLTIGYSVGSEVVVRLKWGQTEYKGILQSIDSYMNVLLQDTVEFIDGQETGALGLVMIRYVFHEGLESVSFALANPVSRCNNILWMGDASTVQMTTPASQ